ncbi:MAG: AI-2E family transporter, partial [Actinobacteria bacterium]|nr:AI-2E family transporter [Actinomycetota bacterium]
MTTIPAQPAGDGQVTSVSQRAGELLSTRVVLRIVLTVLVVIGTIALIWVLWQPITWIIVAAFVAVALAGPVNLLARVMPRWLAITLVYIAVLLIPIGISAAVLPPIVDQGVNFVNDLPGYADNLQNEVQKNPDLAKLNQDFGLTNEVNRIAQDAPTKIGEAATIIRDFGSGLVSSLFAGLTIYILSIFMVARGRSWIDGLLSLRSGRESKAASVALDRIANAVGNYIAGAAVQATIAGVCAFVVLTILGVPFAGALAVLYALFDLIPLVG